MAAPGLAIRQEKALTPMILKRHKFIAFLICACCVGWCVSAGVARADDDYRNYIRRLLRWPRSIDSPFLLLDEDQEYRLRRMEHHDIVGPLREAVLERSRGYSDPDSPWYLGPEEVRRPLGLRQANLRIMRYYCSALLDMGFVSFVEHSRDVRYDGRQMLLDMIEELAKDYQTPADRSAADVLIQSSELAAELTIAYDLLEQSLDTKERHPTLAFLEEERAFLSAMIHRRFPEVAATEQRMEIAACLGLTTLFCSAKSADLQDHRTYQSRYGGFVNDLLWSVDVCRRSWEELSETTVSVEPDALAYPAYYSVLFVEALRRVGGPDLRSELPLASFVSSIADRRVPGEALIVDTAGTSPQELAPDTWPPALRNPFWIEGEGRIGSDVRMGLGFQEITTTDRDRVTRAVIEAFTKG